MTEGIKIYKTQDLVLQVKQNYNPAKLNLKKWVDFIDVLCGDREYQKEAIRDAIIFLASGEYKSIENLIEENFRRNDELQKRYKDVRDYQRNLPLPHKLSAVVDLATATGKSYVIYGIGQIALGLGLVDKVLVLCPSLTIESGLKEKFEKLSGDNNIKVALPDDAVFKNPRIIDANSTIKNGDICVEKYRLIKPLTILVTKDISKAKTLREDLIDFLEKREKISRKAVEKKVLIVTSHKDHKKNVLELKNVDDKDNSVEWIISVSMLTEGWDVKNVFQIVPWEDRAFNSKLLIAQVLGRGLRIPEEYKSPQPKVRVFNHDAWSRNIRGLVDEILEIEVRLTSEILTSGDRAKYNFALYTIDYEKQETAVKAGKEIGRA